MKLYHIAAATLLIGTSALAWQPEPQTPEAAAVAVEAKETSAETGQQMKKAVNDVLEQAATPKLQPAGTTTWEPQASMADPDLDLAERPAPIDAEAVDSGVADSSTQGVGGPVETAALDLTTRPAAQNYPPCRPGPGDDNCIQLYEPGVRTALAAWNRPTGGLSDGQTATAMGGPYEPVEAGNVETAMNGDGTVEGAFGETADLETGA